METIIAAGIGGAVTLAVCLINNHFTHKRTLAEQRMHSEEMARRQHEQAVEMEAKQQQTIAIIEYKLDELTREVREHNNFARRMPVVEEQIKVINHRIHDLENDGK
ncbi:MAG: hypothetical protein IJZ23_06825 [Roseburia sp.]|nr:hypothetical protein [Roseburia sp.]MBQ8279538.1 hypothetical protein [Roseburia sp.]